MFQKKLTKFTKTIKSMQNYPKTLLALMRFSFSQFIFAICFVSISMGSGVNAQEILTKRMSLNIENQSVKVILKNIEKTASIKFIYNPKIVEANSKISVRANEQTLESILKDFLTPLQLSYEVVGNKIILNRMKLGTVNVENLNKSLNIFSPNINDTFVTGLVKNENGEPLPGVSISIKGSTVGTTTDNSGKYSIKTTGDNSTLVFSSIGYSTQEVIVGKRSLINIMLTSSNTQLNEVIAVGYGTQVKRDITGSMSSIKLKDLSAVPVSSSDQMLQGRVAGLQVTQASSAPGGGISIRIRGSSSVNAGNEPLFVIDGFPVYSSNDNTPAGVGERTGGNSLSSINPNDVESIEVLKDASATAIYGSRGANGVVLITTKRGKSGQNKINFSSYYGVSEVTNRYNLMNSNQLAGLANNFGKNFTPVVVPYSTVPTTNTDWQKEVFKTGSVQSYNLGFSGGNETTNYLISGDYYKENGVVLGSGFERIALRFNLDKTFSKTFKFGNSLTISRTDRDTRDIVETTLTSRPFSPVFDANGNYFLETATSFGGTVSRIDNPVAVGNLKVDKTLVTRAIGNLYGEYKILDGLTAKVMFGADLSYSGGRGFSPSTILEGLAENSFANLSSLENVSWLNENTLTYSKKISEHHSLTALIGNSFQKQEVLKYSIRRSGFPTDATSYYIASAGANDRNYSPSGSFNTALQSFFARVNYGLDNKYLFTFTVRQDGSSKFGDGKKYGLFPSGAFAWRLSDESFMKDLSFLNDAKLRVSYGITGNQEIPPYRSLTVLRADRGQIIGGDQVTGFSLSGDLPNPDLGWEQTGQFDIGLDLSLFKSRVNITADYYNKNTTDLLFQTPVPIETGFSTQWRNIGNVTNKGFELSINSNNVNSSAFKWSTDANFSMNMNEVTSLPDGTIRNADGSKQILVNLFPGTSGGIDGVSAVRTGHSLGSFNTYVFDGIWQTNEEIKAAGDGFKDFKPGDVKYKDLNKDGKIDGNDRTITGHGIPKYVFGLNNTFGFQNFELNVFFQGISGVDVLNLTRYNLEKSVGASNTTVEMANRWTGPNTSNTVPRVGPTNFLLTDRFVEKGDYIRLRSVTLSYKFPVDKWNLKWLSGLKIYATGQNLLTVTNYTGFDPEVNIAGQAQALQGIDSYSYPNQKRFVFGLNVGF
jgi:TonB-dependent starch-binding outer membrane protein SusC